jgi:hypothetical protein
MGGAGANPQLASNALYGVKGSLTGMYHALDDNTT